MKDEIDSRLAVSRLAVMAFVRMPLLYTIHGERMRQNCEGGYLWKVSANCPFAGESGNMEYEYGV